jgi:hypothetical protein
MLPDVIVALIHEFHDAYNIVQRKITLNRLVRYAYSEWIFSKGKTEQECKHDVWTRSIYPPEEYYVDEDEWGHFLSLFLLYDYSLKRERNHLKQFHLKTPK